MPPVTLLLESQIAVVIWNRSDKTVFTASQGCDQSRSAQFHGRRFHFFVSHLPYRGEQLLAASGLSWNIDAVRCALLHTWKKYSCDCNCKLSKEHRQMARVQYAQHRTYGSHFPPTWLQLIGVVGACE